MRIVSLHTKAFDEYLDWNKIDSFIFKRINTLIKAILREPFTGIGKPEPLKYNNYKFWSRRISKEHRLIYRVFDDKILITSCKGHYQ